MMTLCSSRPWGPSSLFFGSRPSSLLRPPSYRLGAQLQGRRGVDQKLCQARLQSLGLWPLALLASLPRPRDRIDLSQPQVTSRMMLFLFSGGLPCEENARGVVWPEEDLLGLGNRVVIRQSGLAKGHSLLSRCLLLEICSRGAQSTRSDGWLITICLHSQRSQISAPCWDLQRW